MTLDKVSPIPLYYQLAELIREQIESGELKPGDQLPSERELGERADISRMTARQAVAYLVNQGTLVARPGVGTFVVEPKLTHDALHLLGFTEEMIHKGWAATSRVLEQTLVTPPPPVTTWLELKPGEPAVKIVRLRLSQDVPLLLETIFLPAALCPGLESEDLGAKSLYTLLEQRYGLRLERARQTFESTTANEYEARLFGITPGAPMILLEGVTYGSQGRPLEYFKAVYRGDRFKFELDSYRNDLSYELSGTQRVSLALGLKP